MSAFMHPTGPEPPSVYWIRRAAIVLIVVTLIVALWWMLSSVLGGSSDESTASDSTTSPSASASAEPSASASAEATNDGTAVECADSSIAVEATTDASTYPVGSTPKLTLTIQNIGTVACKRDVGPKANELEITSGGYHVWSSDDCNASNKSKIVVLDPGQKAQSSIAWNGRLSQKGCPNGDGELAKAGRYDLTGRNGKVTSPSTPFALTNQG